MGTVGVLCLSWACTILGREPPSIHLRFQQSERGLVSSPAQAQPGHGHSTALCSGSPSADGVTRAASCHPSVIAGESYKQICREAMEKLPKAGMKTPASQEQQHHRFAEQKRSVSLWSEKRIAAVAESDLVLKKFRLRYRVQRKNPHPLGTQSRNLLFSIFSESIPRRLN